MKNRLVVSIAVILAGGLIANTVLLFQVRDSLKDAQTETANLKQNVSTLTTNITGLQTQVSSASTSIQGLVSAVADVVAKVEPAMVRVDVTLTNAMASGSGSIIDKRGFVLTNYHVIDGAESIKVTVMKTGVFDGTVVAGDKARDLALVSIASNRTDFPTVTLGTAADIVVGEDVMAVGFPLGTELTGPATFTKGIVSAMRVLEDGLNYIQTDATINPGNSGGCLFTLDGKIIGIPSAVIVPQTEDIEGLGLAIPIDDILAFIQKNLK